MNMFQLRGGGGWGGGGGGSDGEVGESIDGPHETLGWVIYWFLMKFANAKELVTDRQTDGPTDRPTDGHILLLRCVDASKKWEKKNKMHAELHIYFESPLGN